jgi:hypothetical protein
MGGGQEEARPLDVGERHHSRGLLARASRRRRAQPTALGGFTHAVRSSTGRASSVVIVQDPIAAFQPWSDNCQSTSCEASRRILERRMVLLAILLHVRFDR